MLAQLRSFATMLLVSLLLTACTQSELTELISEYGFDRVSPPRQSLATGTIVFITQDKGGIKVVKPVCWPNQGYPGLVEPHDSDTMTAALKNKIEKEFTLEADYLKRLNGKLTAAEVQEVELSIVNPLVKEVSLTDLAVAEKRRIAECSLEMSKLATKEIKTYVISSVLSADVQYQLKVSNSASLEVEVKEQILKSAAAELGGRIASVKDLTLSGKELHWGIYLDEADAQSSASVLNPDIPGVMQLSKSERSQLLLSGPTVYVMEKSLADLRIEAQEH